MILKEAPRHILVMTPRPPAVFVQVWVNSPHSASGYYTIYGEESLQADHFNTKLSFGDPQTLWSRTGYLGFIKRTELLDASGGETAFDESGVLLFVFLQLRWREEFTQFLTDV